MLNTAIIIAVVGLIILLAYTWFSQNKVEIPPNSVDGKFKIESEEPYEIPDILMPDVPGKGKM